MTQSEYGQKKRKCWEELSKEILTIGGGKEKRAFDFAFDRAYALGRETETITQEEIYNQFKEKVLNNDFLADKSDPSFVDRHIEYTKVYKWVVNALGKQEKKPSLTDKEVYALESSISELESLIEGTLDEDYRKEQKSIISALKRIIKKYEKK